jgi:hypothetical protein
MVASSTVTQKLYTGCPLLLIITKSPSVSKFQLTFMKLSDDQFMYITIYKIQLKRNATEKVIKQLGPIEA